MYLVVIIPRAIIDTVSVRHIETDIILAISLIKGVEIARSTRRKIWGGEGSTEVISWESCWS